MLQTLSQKAALITLRILALDHDVAEYLKNLSQVDSESGLRLVIHDLKIEIPGFTAIYQEALLQLSCLQITATPSLILDTSTSFDDMLKRVFFIHENIFKWLSNEALGQLSRVSRYFLSAVKLFREKNPRHALQSQRAWIAPTANCLMTQDVPQSLIVRPSGELISASRNGLLEVWQRKSDRYHAKQTLKVHDAASVVAIAALSDSELVTSASDHTTKLWACNNAGQYACKQVIKIKTTWIQALAVIPLQRELVAGANDGCLRIWSGDPIQCMQTITGHHSWVTAIGILSSKEFVSGSANGEIKLWYRQAINKPFVRTQAFDGPMGYMSMITVPESLSVICTANQQLMVLSRDNRGYYQLHQQMVAHNDHINALHRLTTGEVVTVSKDGVLKIWQLDTKGMYQCIQVIREEGNNNAMHAVSMLPSGELAVGTEACTVRLYQFPKLTPLFHESLKLLAENKKKTHPPVSADGGSSDVLQKRHRIG